MIKKIKVEQFVIIEKLELDFDKGLTIITGETGAGKSIILGAMNLLLGEENKPKSVRQGHEQSILEAVFAPPKDNEIWKILIKENICDPADIEFTIHRTMKKSGEDSIKINSQTITLETLKEWGNYLVEIHGQHANHNLLKPENQLNLLDLSGGYPTEFLDNVGDALKEVHRLNTALEEEKKFLATHKKKMPNISRLVKTFEDMAMEEGLVNTLQNEYTLLQTAKDTYEAFQAILGRMITTNGVVGSLSASYNTLKDSDTLDKEKVSELMESLNQAIKHSRNAVSEIGRLAPDYEIDTAPLRQAKKTLNTLETISSEEKVPMNDMYEFYLDTTSKLNRFKNGRETLNTLDEQLKQAKGDYIRHAEALSEKRKIAATELGKAITNELPPLKLEKAQFEVIVEAKPEKPWTEKGMDEVTFTGRMNLGTPFSPIAETASGGELARMILGLKVVLQKVQTTPTLVFDEVDTGIGGAAAAAVGSRISKLSNANTQVLVITHSAQVASCGDHHYHVSKRDEGNTTISTITPLSMDERIEEISRMLAGTESTTESQAAAQKLMTEAKNFN